VGTGARQYTCLVSNVVIALQGSITRTPGPPTEREGRDQEGGWGRRREVQETVSRMVGVPVCVMFIKQLLCTLHKDTLADT
jgi:hypothetical protein